MQPGFAIDQLKNWGHRSSRFRCRQALARGEPTFTAIIARATPVTVLLTLDDVAGAGCHVVKHQARRAAYYRKGF
jgi:hypothetical protein